MGDVKYINIAVGELEITKLPLNLCRNCYAYKYQVKFGLDFYNQIKGCHRGGERRVFFDNDGVTFVVFDSCLGVIVSNLNRSGI